MIKIQVVAMDVHQLEQLRLTIYEVEDQQLQRILVQLDQQVSIRIQVNLLEKLIEEMDYELVQKHEMIKIHQIVMDVHLLVQLNQITFELVELHLVKTLVQLVLLDILQTLVKLFVKPFEEMA